MMIPKGNTALPGAAISRRLFLAALAASLGGLALAGCSSNTGQPSHEESVAGSSEAASSTGGGSADSRASESRGTADSQTGLSGKILVACFSATGNTRVVAQAAAGHLGADYFEIEPAVLYTAEDLDYGDETARATAEQNDLATRPAIAAAPDFAAYDVVLLGHPIWWGKAPRLMCTLLEGADLAGKRVAEFCTSGSSGIDGAAVEFQGLAPDADWIGARRFAAGASESEVAGWIDSLGLQ